MFEGSDPALKSEYVIMTAHLDHVGIGRAVNGDAIYNGAMDDASGVAAVIETARLLKASGVKTKRSVIFVAVTAEEKGLLGSRYFAGRPTVPFKQIVANINLDMFLPLYPLKVIEVQGFAESSLGESVRAAAKTLGVEVQTDREPEQNRFIRSDQYSFIRKGVPALAFKFGYEFGSPEETIRRNWVRDVYHKPERRHEAAGESRSRGHVQPRDHDAAAARGQRHGPAHVERGQLLQAIRRPSLSGRTHNQSLYGNLIPIASVTTRRPFSGCVGRLLS